MGIRSTRLQELVGKPPGLLIVPEPEPGSLIDRDDDREWASKHGDLTVSHQVSHRLFAAFEHLGVHNEGWSARRAGRHFHVYPEFTLLRGALEATAAAWWLLESDSSQDRVLRALASKVKEAHYEAQAANMGMGPPGSGDELVARVAELVEKAAREAGGIAGVPKFPHSSTLVDNLASSTGVPVDLHWRICSSYAHGFDWAAWHHRKGEASATVPYRELADAFVVACDALHQVWTKLWLPLALENLPTALPPVFLPFWPERDETLTAP